MKPKRFNLIIIKILGVISYLIMFDNMFVSEFREEAASIPNFPMEHFIFSMG